MAPLLLDETQVIEVGIWIIGLVALVALGGLFTLIFNPRWFIGRLLGLVVALAFGLMGAAWSDARHAEWSKLLLFSPFVISIFTVLFFPRQPPE